jgi:phosphoribosyl-AMP cyclohydrolase / phosphoribosyl-ATP pyrophosphohydrolase
MSLDPSALKWDAAGLVVVVAQDRHDGTIRMVGYANEEALRQTIDTGEACFFSRSRQSLWRKGETSGHSLTVSEVWTDCDGDAVVYLVDPVGPTCHTGEATCFFRRLWLADATPGVRAAPTLSRLSELIDARRASSAEASYTKSLLDKGAVHIGAKVEEEAGELAAALRGETDDRVVSEAADVMYHVLVGLAARGLDLRAVAAKLGSRLGVSGHDEKASRGQVEH